MQPFVYQSATSVSDAVGAAGTEQVPTTAAAQFLAGGTTILDLMKLDVMQPAKLVDITRLDDAALRRIDISDAGVRIGALAKMAQVADIALLKQNYPALVQALAKAASPQLRNMATIGGNLLQRTRCSYFRETSWACNKRNPGSGCAALEGVNRLHAVLGTSDACIASYPGDFAQALIAFDAEVEIAAARGTRRIPFATLHRQPGREPHIETTLAASDVIIAVHVPAGAYTRRSLYLKVRDRESYAFALASAAIGLEVRDGVIRQARIALGGIATVPWRAREAEAVLTGQKFSDALAQQAADAALGGARSHKHNAYKIPLGKKTVIRGLRAAMAMEA